MEKQKCLCDINCEFLHSCQEEYDSEPMGFCSYKKKLEYVSSMDDIFNKDSFCIHDKPLVQLKTIAKLGYNWNDNGAEPFSEELINKCLFFEKFLAFEHDIFPTACNSIQFEFNLDNTYIEVEMFEDCIDVFVKNDSKEIIFNYEHTIKDIISIINLLKFYYIGIIKDVAVFSGAFNPPTKAHNHVIKRILEKDNFNVVVVALANEKFLKRKQDRKKDISFSEEDRLLMMLNMTYLNPHVLIYGIEDGYTFEILSNVKEKFVNKNVYFIAGSDKIKQIPKWGFGEKLLKEFGFVFLTRGDEFEKIKKECRDIFYRFQLIDSSTYENLSATKVRNALKNKENYESMVHPNVFEVLEDIKDKYFK